MRSGLEISPMPGGGTRISLFGGPPIGGGVVGAVIIAAYHQEEKVFEATVAPGMEVLIPGGKQITEIRAVFPQARK